MARKYTMIHDSMLVRWLMRTFPFGTWKLNARLGAVKEELIKTTPVRHRRFLENYKLIADAVVIFEEKATIVECVVRPGEFYKIQQLNTYERAFKVTEEYRKYWDWPVEKILLTTETDAFMESEAAREGIRVVKWTAPDIEYYKEGIKGRHRIPRGSGLEIL